MAYSTFDDIFGDFFFKDFFNSKSIFKTVGCEKASYPYDVRKTTTGLSIDIAAVDTPKDSFKISVDDDVLRVVHERDEQDDSKYIYKGITKRSFDLAWKIPKKFNLTKLTAKLKQGILSIDIPYNKESKPQSFEITID